MSKVIVNIDDWEGLYIDGELVSQGHHVTWRDLEELGIIDEALYPENFEEWEDLPQTLEEAKARI